MYALKRWKRLTPKANNLVGDAQLIWRKIDVQTHLRGGFFYWLRVLHRPTPIDLDIKAPSKSVAEKITVVGYADIVKAGQYQERLTYIPSHPMRDALFEGAVPLGQIFTHDMLYYLSLQCIAPLFEWISVFQVAHPSLKLRESPRL